MISYRRRNRRAHGKFVGLSHETIERKRSEAALRRSEATIRSIVETAISGIVTIDQTGRIILFNPAAERMFGYNSLEVIGENVKILMPSPFQEEHDLYLRNFLETGKCKIIGIGREVVGRKKNGVVFPIDLAVSMVDVDETTLFVGIITDATQRKKAEQSLLEAKQLAESANHYKSEFLATMSHEIRTPMHAILGLLHLTLQTELNDKQRNYITKIQNSSKCLLEIVNDVLDFSKLGAGKLSLEAIDFFMDDILSHVANLVEIQADAKGLKLSFDRSPEVPNALIGDPTRLGQILVNLTNNAVKFTESGNIGVSIQKKAFQDNRVQVSFRISDTGIGMTPEQCATIFQTFTQGDVSTTRRYGGSGLGLFICKQLVEMMEGEIGVVSEVGRGSVFTFTVWLRLPEKKQYNQDFQKWGNSIGNSSFSRDSKTIWNIPGLNVLLVDDAAINQEIVTEFLGGVDINVTVAGNGSEAVRQVEDRLFDIILMDIQMPIMDGITATKLIRNLPNGRDLPILAMTASILDSDHNKCLEAGMNGFITKPIEPEEILKILCNHFPEKKKNLIDMTKEKENFEANKYSDILHGIDLEIGLNRVGGNMTLLRKIWKRFLDEYVQGHYRIREALEQNNREKALLTAHTLKGVSGTIGAVVLQQSVTRLESDLKSSDDLNNISSLLKLVENELYNISEGINSYFSWNSLNEQQKESNPLTHIGVISLLDELVVMIQEMNPLAEEKAEWLVGCLTGEPGYDLARKLVSKISNTEFEDALAILKEIDILFKDTP
ncbi:MAG: PAS domain S-box protein [Magnetococcales bacterium]|nr:PAS domain S-box protein [Magnetococcales bacterium]